MSRRDPNRLYVRIVVGSPTDPPSYGQAVDYLYEAHLSLEEMKNIREIRCSVVNDESRRR
jgi:hypothetical protein